MRSPKKFWSVEYKDDDGDLVTTNVVATKEEMERLMEEFACRGTKAVAYDLSPPAVISGNEPPKQMG